MESTGSTVPIGPYSSPPSYSGLIWAGWILVGVLCLVAVVPFVGFLSWILAGPMLLAAIVLAIIALTRGGTAAGIVLLIASVFAAPVFILVAPVLTSAIGIGVAANNAPPSSNQPTSGPIPSVGAPLFSPSAPRTPLPATTRPMMQPSTPDQP